MNTFSSITLLSGGLDSFCGVYENLKNSHSSLYCGYKTNNFETHNQNLIKNFIQTKYNLAYKLFNKIECKKNELTQRTRSLLFISLACVYAVIYNVNVINLYENGVLSLNPEIHSRKTTKTTHPRTLFLINSVLNLLDLQIQINHPFIFYTKGQMINRLPIDFKLHIKDTHTCGSSRSNPQYDVTGGKHCGACIPCTLRKISIASHDLEEYDREYSIPYGSRISSIAKMVGDFKSSNEYFKTFKDKIDSGEIWTFLRLNSKYYKDMNYLTKTESLLLSFSKEVEYYYRKYPI